MKTATEKQNLLLKIKNFDVNKFYQNKKTALLREEINQIFAEMEVNNLFFCKKCFLGNTEYNAIIFNSLPPFPIDSPKMDISRNENRIKCYLAAKEFVLTTLKTFFSTQKP